MAKVFLSYDRDDTERARPVALALEKAGHAVWWDLHIRGGEQFTKAIDEALAAADAVVVLWSKYSVDSAWVRDEAAAGRDTGRLIPVSLDQTNPPLGFRQYQTIDLSRWNGRRRSLELKALLADVEAMSREAKPPAASPARTIESQSLSDRFPKRWALIAILLVAVAAAVLLWRPWSGGPAGIAIAAADSSPPSEEMARELLAALGQMQAARSEGLELLPTAEQQRASLVFRVGATRDGQGNRANLVLLRGSNGSLLWSRSFERRSRDYGDLRQELTYSAAQVLRCALETHPDGRPILKAAALKLYLNGCADFADREEGSIVELLPTFRKVVSIAPRFEGGWSKLLNVESQAYVNRPNPRMLAQLRSDIREARKVNPEMAAAFAAQMDTLPDGAWAEKLALADRGIAANPSDTWLLLLRGELLAMLGYIREGIDDRRMAVRADPLSIRLRRFYIIALSDGGRFDAALNELQEAERLWPDSSSLLGTKVGFHFSYGDPRIALQIIRSGELAAGWARAEPVLQARIDPTPAKIEAAVETTRAIYRQNEQALIVYVETLAMFGRQDELHDVIMSASHNSAVHSAYGLFRANARGFWRDPRSLAYAKRVGLLQHWQSSGKWPDFCFEPDLPYDCKKEAARLLA